MAVCLNDFASISTYLRGTAVFILRKLMCPTHLTFLEMFKLTPL
jgi:hypothetical protein